MQLNTLLKGKPAAAKASGGEASRGACLVARAKGKGQQKNQGMYFEYEKVDPEAHKQVFVEKAKVQQEFSWVKQARVSAGLIEDRPSKQHRPNKQRRPATTQQSSTSTAQPPSRPKQEQQPSTPAAEQGAPAASEVAASDAAASGKMSSRKQQLMARMNSQASPAAAAADVAAPAAAPATPAPAPPVAPSKPAPAAPAMAALPGMAAAAAALPPVMDITNADEAQVRNMLQQLLQLDEGELSQLASEADLGALGAQAAQGQAQFDSWLQQVRQQQSQAGGEQGQDVEAAAAENEAALQQAAAAESSIAALLAAGGRDLADMKSVLGQLAGVEEDKEEDPDVPEMTEEQVLAQLRVSDPELYALLAPEDGLDYGEEERELVRALNTMQRLGFGGDEPASASQRKMSDIERQLLAGSGLEEEDDLLGNDDEDISDAELAEMARSDPDLAALLRSDSLGGDFDKLLRRLEGDEEEEEGGAGQQEAGDEEDGVEFGDLFDALDEDLGLDEQEQLKARYELQSMFNAPGREGGADSEVEAPSQVSRGITTTGRAATSEATPQLLPKPKPRAN